MTRPQFPLQPRATGTTRLRDGRHLGWAEFGDPDGDAVLWFHGSPGARSQVPHDLDAAYLVVLHVSARGPSVLPAILERATQLPAAHAVDGQQLEVGHIYVAPPDRHLGYAVQWFALALAVLAIATLLTLRGRRRR